LGFAQPVPKATLSIEGIEALWLLCIASWLWLCSGAWLL